MSIINLLKKKMHFWAMINRWKQKWNVNGWQLILILTTFALGGSLCGVVGRKILGLLNLDKNVLYYILYVVIMTLIWPLCVILVSIPLGQFVFFKNYLKKVFARLSGKRP
jgi:hypothetical protein